MGKHENRFMRFVLGADWPPRPGAPSKEEKVPPEREPRASRGVRDLGARKRIRQELSESALSYFEQYFQILAGPVAPDGWKITRGRREFHFTNGDLLVLVRDREACTIVVTYVPHQDSLDSSKHRRWVLSQDNFDNLYPQIPQELRTYMRLFLLEAQDRQ